MAFPTTTSAYEMDGLNSESSHLVNNVNQAANMISSLRDTAAYNSAWSATQAEQLRDWQVQQNATAMAFNREEAAKNRDWQKMMSDTAHQREIRDLQAAGLNPVLSAMGGNGAAVTSGATASGVTSSGAKGEADTSLNSALVNLLGSIYNRTTQLEAANINARTQEAVADKYNATSQIVAMLGAEASKYGSDKAAQSAIRSAMIHLTGTEYASRNNLLSAKYASDNSLLAALAKNEMDKLIARNKISGPSDLYRYVLNDVLEWVGASDWNPDWNK